LTTDEQQTYPLIRGHPRMNTTKRVRPSRHKIWSWSHRGLSAKTGWLAGWL